MPNTTHRTGGLTRRNALAAAAAVALALPLAGPLAAQTAEDPLIVALPDPGQGFDPTSMQFGPQARIVSRNIFEWLFEPSAEGPQPALAESWEQPGDGSVLRVTLRDGVTFHSGHPLTAEDVVFSWNRMVENKVNTRFSRSLETVEALDDRTVEFTFRGPDVAFLAGGGMPVASKAHFDEAGEEAFVATPNGTGPYRAVGVAPGQSLDLEAFDGYWGAAPYVAAAGFRFIPDDNTRVLALRAGDVDGIVGIPPAQVADLQADDAYNVVLQAPGSYTMWLQGQWANPDTPWADIRVRQAMAAAINSDAIIDRVLGGMGERYAALAPEDLGYDASLEPYAYDLDRARALMEEAGHGDGFTAEMGYPTGIVGGIRQAVDALVLSLGQIGIQLEPTPLSGPQFQQFVAGRSNDPEQDYLALFSGTLAGATEPTSGLRTHFTADGPFARYFNMEVSDRINQAAASLDRDARGDLVREAMAIMHEDYAFIPVMTSTETFALPAGLAFEPTRGNYAEFAIANITPAE